MTRLAVQHEAVNLSQGFPNEPPPFDMVWAGVSALVGGTSEGAQSPSSGGAASRQSERCRQSHAGGGRARKSVTPSRARISEAHHHPGLMRDHSQSREESNNFFVKGARHIERRLPHPSPAAALSLTARLLPL